MIAMPQAVSQQAGLSIEQAVKLLNDPLVFSSLFWPDMTVYDRQAEILYSVRDNKTTFVHGANTMGKDRTTALASLWFFYTRIPCKVITTSSSSRQLGDVLWGEINSLIQSAKRPFNLILKHLEIRRPLPGGKPDEEIGDTYLVGRVTKRVENLHGHHLDRSVIPRVLFAYDESSGIDDPFWEAGESQFHRALAVGNPMNTRNFFYKECAKGNAAYPKRHPDAKPGSLLRKVIHLDGRKSPNVIAGRAWARAGLKGTPPTMIPGVLSYAEFLERLTWPPHKRRTRLFGMFVDDGDDRLFPDSTLDHAQELGAKLWPLRGKLRHGAKAMGIDCGQGGDPTVWTVVGRYGVIKIVRKITPKPSAVLGMTIRLMRQFRVDYVEFDASSGGHEHADTLRDRGYSDVEAVFFGSSPDAIHRDEYRNMRCQLYGELAKIMRPTVHSKAILDSDPEDFLKAWTCFAIPPEDGELREDLAVLPIEHDGEGKLKLRAKDRQSNVAAESGEKTIKEMLGRSPDTGDSVALAVRAYLRMRDAQSVRRVNRPAVY